MNQMPEIRWESLKKIIQKRSYGILCTISKKGGPHATGVLYAWSDSPLALYVLTDSDSVKARNLSRNPNIAFVIPVPRRLMKVPPSSVQFQGVAEIISLSQDVEKAFSRSIILRRTFNSVRPNLDKDGTRIIKIIPGQFVHTYGIGVSVMGLIRRPDDAVGKVRVES